MKRQTFVLTKKRWFRWTVRLFLKGEKNKIDQRNIKFTTEHKVSEKERNRNARKIAAEYSTSDEVLIDALYRSTGYGKTFVHADDPKGERKREPFVITPLDARKIALSNLFKSVNLEFDGTKSAEVLTEEYNIYISAKTGVTIKESTAKEVIFEKRDVSKDMSESVELARKAYEDKYGKPIPEEFKNDLGFLSALADPKWDAKAYMAEQGKIDTDGLPDTAAELWPIYQEEFGKNVANPKKNDATWIKAEIEANRVK